MKALITGAAGFIGFHLAQRLLARGDLVVGIDNLNPYYDIALKRARLAQLASTSFRFVHGDIADAGALRDASEGERFHVIVNLAAQPGVRYSLVNPRAYVDANLVGFANVLELARELRPRHLVYASTSSIYGLNTALPFAESQNTDHPVSLYAATKKANEVMAHAYAHLFSIPCTGLRFFTVYGPWSRPDMALFKFTRGILAGEAIPVFNEGRMVRDFTYVDDIVEGIVRVIDRPPAPDPSWNADEPDPATSSAPWRVYNIGNHERVDLMRYIRAIEAALGVKAKLDFMPMQPGEVEATEADTAALESATGFKPAMTVEEGVRRFVTWYRDYYRA